MLKENNHHLGKIRRQKHTHTIDDGAEEEGEEEGYRTKDFYDTGGTIPPLDTTKGQFTPNFLRAMIIQF